MKKNTYTFLVIAITLVTILFAGCGSQGAQDKADNALYIGVAGPFTGDNGEYGTMWKKGLEIALEEINAKGGVKGRPIKLIYEDSQSDPKQAAILLRNSSKMSG